MPSSVSPRRHRSRSRSKGRGGGGKSASRSRSRSPVRRRERSRTRSRTPPRRRTRSRSADRHRRSGGSGGGYYAKVGNRDDPDPCKVLGVFGLSYDTDERDLRRTFGKFGDIEQIKLVCDPEGRSRGFGFISFYSLEDAKYARSEMCDKTMDGKKIRVDFSISNGPHEKTPGQYYGGGGRPRSSNFRGGDRYRPRRSPTPPRYRSRRERSYSPRRY